MNLKTSRKRKRKTSTPPEPVPELSDQIVQDILVRQPVKSLLRCKAWRAIISDPFFTRAHLRWSASRWEEEEGWPTNFSNHIRFYQWQQGASMATFMHAEDFDCKFSFVRYFAHCDGLVLAPTDTGIYLFNPATRETVTLPISIRHHEEATGTGMRMEVLTVSCNGGAAAWREIAEDLPYPACNWRTAVTVNGFLFWRVAKHLPGLPPRGLIHLSLADETLGITTLPDSVDPVLPDAFALDDLHGELCLRGFFHPLAFLRGGRIMLKAGFDISIYDMATAKLTTVWQMDRLKYQGRRARTWKNLFVFNALR
ncbi:hypothetical protein GQ55_1G021100 [Panicum hallii var. hallii]|uniref:F-box domain-containing protein n=1 Tax=Panicum hallii var. hallii TaxID=1504633 RepID=A0A2T7F1A6_9POAL|nr:hypothetical protein GQ55_1G021100 [Panicum hallii var. hallii]